jgi:CRP/FNR family transcriptional regulator, cyclic AMP receptor protein
VIVRERFPAILTGGGLSGPVDLARTADLLNESPLFACLGQADRLALAARMRPRHFARDEVVFHESDEGGQVFLIVAGTVKISIPDETGREVVIALERGGDVFGELALFDDAPRSATVTAITETSTLSLGRADFMAVLERNSDAMRRMLVMLAKIVRRSTGHVEDLVFLDLAGRVAKCLLDISESSGTDQVDLTQEDLAGFVGAARVSVNRALADLEGRRAIRIGRRHIEIVDREQLRRDIRH